MVIITDSGQGTNCRKLTIQHDELVRRQTVILSVFVAAYSVGKYGEFDKLAAKVYISIYIFPFFGRNCLFNIDCV